MYNIFFALYRWDGTTRDEFVEHYLSSHVNLGKELPHVVSYTTFLNKQDPAEQDGPPRPDAFAVIDFGTEQRANEALASPVFAEAQRDNHGFISRYDTYFVERHDLV